MVTTTSSAGGCVHYARARQNGESGWLPPPCGARGSGTVFRAGGTIKCDKNVTKQRGYIQPEKVGIDKTMGIVYNRLEIYRPCIPGRPWGRCAPCRQQDAPQPLPVWIKIPAPLGRGGLPTHRKRRETARAWAAGRLVFIGEDEKENMEFSAPAGEGAVL